MHVTSKRWATAYLPVLLLAACGDRTYNNPVDPGAKKTDGTAATDKPADGGTTTSTSGGAGCLGESCTTSTSNYLTLNSVKFIGDSCSASDVRILKNESLNRLTVIYRANYQSEGIWQLYARNVNVAADGALSLVGTSPTNLFPNRCVGNTQGVTSYLISGYRSGSSTSKVFNYTNASDTTDFSIDMTCYSAALNQSNVFVASTFSPGVDTTTPFLEKDGAIGYFKSKNIYVKPNGTTINADGTSNSFVIPGNWTSSGSNYLGPIQKIYGNDAAGGIYLKSLSAADKYVSSVGAVSTLANSISYDSGPPSTIGIGGIYHSIFGMYVFSGYVEQSMYGFNLAAQISTSSDSLFSSVLLVSKADKAVFLSTNGPNSLYDFNFQNGKFIQKTAAFNEADSNKAVGFGAYSKRVLFYDGKCSIYLTSDYF